MEAGLGGGNLSWAPGGQSYEAYGANDFSDKVIRQGFIRKVFGILGVQLAITTAVCALFMTSSGVSDYMKTHQWPIWTSMGGSFVTMIAMVCNPQLTRRFPMNYGLLGVFTVFESVMVGFICIASKQEAVLAAAGITAFITLGLTAFALQSKYDFTTSNGILSGAVLALVLVSVARMFFPRVPFVEMAIAGGGAFLFSCFIVVDIQMLMDGNRVQLDPDDYIMGALQLYLDIINLFLYILKIINESRRD